MTKRTILKTWPVISIFLVVLGGAATVAGKTIYVDDDGPADFNNIQAAIDDSNDGDIVIVANGTYTGDGNRDIDFRGKAITLRSENGPESCIIDCNGTEADPHRGFYFHSGEDANSVLDGFTITNGYGLEEQFASYMWSFGGAIYCKRSGPTITNCIITGNEAIQGAGIFAWKNSSPTIINCTVSGNTGRGGIYCWDNSIVLIADCVISGNDGKGIFCWESIGIEISNCEISNNRRAGIDFVCDGPWVISNCTISGNQGPGIHFAAFDDGMISNCIISDNTANIKGGGIRVGTYNESIVMINNCTISGNSADMGGGVCCSYGNTIITSSIVWNNNGEDIYLYNHPPAPYDGYTIEPTKLSVSYSCSGIIFVQEDPIFGDPILILGDGNIDADPRFVEPNNGDFHLQPDSLCIDAGTNTPVGGLAATDIEGNPRPLDGDNDGLAVADMGAYEAFLSEETVIELSAEEFEFSVNEGDTDPADQMLTIRNRGGGTLNWVISYDCEWLEVIPSAGSSTGEADEIILSVDISGLTLGMYNCELMILGPNAVNSPRTVAIALHVHAEDELRVPSEFLTIQEAIDAAIVGDTIILADGTYRGEGNRDIDFGGKAITVRSENGSADCIIDCNGTEAEPHRGFYFHNNEDTNSMVDGFTITNGNAYFGGGIYCRNSSPAITNCTISGNSARGDGGGVSCRNSSPTITNCTINSNSATFYGGGTYCYESAPTIINCMVSGNSAIFGGGIANLYSSPALINCTFSKNSGDFGGALQNRDGSNSTVTNCILWGNTPQEIRVDDLSMPVITYSDVKGGWPGKGNIDADPRFANVDANDFHLKSQAGRWDANERRWTKDEVTSPCIDSGNPLTPIGYEPFPNGGIINMGAYGGTAKASKSYFGAPVCETIIAGDINGDCKVDFKDFAIMALHWLEER